MGRKKCGERELYWRELVSRQPQSGLSIREFCAREGVSEPSFFGWWKRLQSTRKNSAGEQQRARQLPKAKLTGAVNYMLNRWDAFTRILESGAVPLDNNAAERAVKYPILGRKAWLFVGNHQAGETAANLFTLTKTCNRLHIDPFAYLHDVYRRLPVTPPEELANLLPDRWLKEHPQHLIPERVQESIDRAQRARERRAQRRAAA